MFSKKSPHQKTARRGNLAVNWHTPRKNKVNIKINYTLNFYQDWLNSAVSQEIITLNVQPVEGLDLFEAINPNPKRLNTGKLNASEQRLFYNCVDWDGYSPVSGGWVCNDRVKILWGKLLDPGRDGKVAKYRNPKGKAAPITFLKVPLHIWAMVAKLHGVAMPENITITDNGEALGFWEWVIKNQVPVVLTEGEKKAGCLLTLGYAAVSVPGISMGWRTTDKDFYGKAIARELHPDLLPFDDGRDITICFDYRRGDYFKSPEWINASILGKLFKNSTVKIARLPGPEKGIDDYVVAGGDVKKIFATAETVKQLQDERLWRSFKGFSPDKVVNQRYLDLEAPEHGKITAIKSGLGTGKTQYLADKVKPEAGKQINIGYRNSLLLQMATKLDSYHLDAHNGYQMMNDPEARLSLCWDSLQKVSGITLENSTLILDEASSSIKHLLSSSTCRDKRVEILDYFKAIAPRVDRVVASDGNLSDSVINFLAEVFKMPVMKIENEFKGDTPPVFFLTLAADRQRIAKTEYEFLAKEILKSHCPAIATDSLKTAEALAKMLTDDGRQGIMLTSKTATEEWAKDFLANPDEYIKRYKPEFLIFTPTAESGLDISIKDYFSDCFCWFVGVIGVDECLQMSRRVRHPQRITICCSQHKLKRKNDGDFSSKLIEVITEQASTEAVLLGHETLTEAIIAQVNTPEMKAWAEITAKENVESRNLHRFLVKSFKDKGFSVQQVNFEALNMSDYQQAKTVCKETEAKEIFYAEDISLAKALEIERNYCASWSERCKVIKAKLKARLPGIENSELWTWEFIHRVRFTERDLLSQLETFWRFENPADAELLQQQKWKREFRTFLPDLDDRWLKLKVLEKLGINKFLDPAAVWTNKSPEILDFVKQCKKKSVAALLGHPGKIRPIQYVNKQLKIIGAQLVGTQVRYGADRVWEYRYQAEGKKSSRPDNWNELYPLVCQKMAEWVKNTQMAESPAVVDIQAVTMEPVKVKHTVEPEENPPPNPREESWRLGCELAEVAAQIAEGAIERAKNRLQQVIKSFGVCKVLDALGLLPEHQRLAIEGLG
ncbi:hypothetical protein BCD67_00215 [Oscillatoriales cyanobacterium USR001]|nr:hypothetical protein BCD67_00215 [Oscillatoriales cyanobacterium USR001]